jgi:hypothetical protein
MDVQLLKRFRTKEPPDFFSLSPFPGQKRQQKKVILFFRKPAVTEFARPRSGPISDLLSLFAGGKPDEQDADRSGAQKISRPFQRGTILVDNQATSALIDDTSFPITAIDDEHLGRNIRCIHGHLPLYGKLLGEDRVLPEGPIQWIPDQDLAPGKKWQSAVVDFHQGQLAGHQQGKEFIGQRKGLEIRLVHWAQGGGYSFLQHAFAPG